MIRGLIYSTKSPIYNFSVCAKIALRGCERDVPKHDIIFDVYFECKYNLLAYIRLYRIYDVFV